MSDLTGDDIFYGETATRLVVEDVLEEARDNPKGYAESLIDLCRDELVEHFIAPLPFVEVSFRVDSDGAINYFIITKDGERSGHIPVEEIHTDSWYYSLLHARNR